MSLAQASGYLRAVAPDFVCQEVDAVLSRRRASRYVRPRVIAQAVEGLLDLLSDDILFAEPVRACGGHCGIRSWVLGLRLLGLGA